MKVSELSRGTGVPIATIKYYLREGLLHPGTPTARNQAEYDDSHAHRLRLIRVLVEIGGLGIATVCKVLATVDDTSVPMHEVLGVAHHALAPQRQVRSSIDLSRATEEIDEWLIGLNWRVSLDAPARHELAGALAALRRLGWEAGPEIFRPYADLADQLADREVASASEQTTRGATVERVVVGTIVFETALLALRRLAQENHSATRFASADKKVR